MVRWESSERKQFERPTDEMIVEALERVRPLIGTRASHLKVGVYLNKEKVFVPIPDEDLIEETLYDINFRVGRALYVDGILIHQGYFSDEAIVDITKAVWDEVRSYL